MTVTVEQFIKEAEVLEGPVLTFYLRTSPHNEEWKIVLKNGLNRTKEYVEAANEEDVSLFERIRKEVERAVRDQQRHFKNGLIGVANSEHVQLLTTQPPVRDEFHWEAQAMLRQLKELTEAYPKTGLVFVQKEYIVLLDVLLGKLIEEDAYELNVDTNDWVRYKGLAYGGIISSSANHRDVFESRMKEHEKQWYRQVAPKVAKHAKDKGWEEVYIVGAKQLTDLFQQEVPKMNVTKVINHNYASKSSAEMIDRVLLSTDE